MRVVIAMVKHETNRFSPVPTPLARFGVDGPLYGADALAGYRGTATPIGAFIDLAESAGAEIVTPIAAEAWPSGPVAEDAYRHLCDTVAEAVSQGCDAILLDLHGAMVTESIDDGEGALLDMLRGLAPDTPIAVALDFHANLTGRMVAHADVIVGYKTYPHIDMYETGRQAGRIGLAAAKGAVRPTMAWGNRPMLPHVIRQGSDDQPMADLLQMARDQEAAGVLAASIFPGFPYSDIADAGLSAVVVTDKDTALAEARCGALLNAAWVRREEFVYHGEPAAEAVARAARMDEGPIMLLDHCDNCGSGGTQDVMTVIREVLDQGLENTVIFAVHDPEAVESLVAAGVGAEVTINLGGKYAMPALGLEGEPLEVSGTVTGVSNGDFTVQGPMYTGVQVAMGRTAVLDTGKAEIVVIERHHEPWDTGCLTSLGIDPAAKRFILLKSRVHWRAGFRPLIKAEVECAGVGVTTSDYALLPFKHVRRPIFPLDPETGAEHENLPDS
ncbi:MAG: microcystin degradation protein MlrC [Alphaproteobacteria bacterium]|jgi:microcystin degradation protein MlrC|nr:microcystin degradation protein MlrC [Alphaproteobacteria bacterium]